MESSTIRALCFRAGSAVAGLLVPGESITDPYEVVRRMLASGPNIETRLGWPVSGVEPDGEGAPPPSLAALVLLPLRVLLVTATKAPVRNMPPPLVPALLPLMVLLVIFRS